MIRQPVTFPGGQPLTRSIAVQVVQATTQFSSRIMIEHDHKIVNAKSMLGLLSLGLEDQTAMTLVVEGEDEQQAAETIAALLK